MSEKSNDLRNAILGNTKPKSEVIEFFGQMVELIQPSLREALAYQSNEDRAGAVADVIIRYCFVPNTKDRVFEETDRDLLLSMPFGSDVSVINKAIARLTGVEDPDALAEAEADEDLKDPLENKS